MNDAMVCAGSSINEMVGEEASVLYITNIYDNNKLLWEYEYYNRNRNSVNKGMFCSTEYFY